MASTREIEMPPFMDDLFGTWYPKDFVVAVINDPTQAGRAAAALREQGLDPDDVHLVTGPEALAWDARFRAQMHPVKHFAAMLLSGSEEGIMEDRYLREAQEGHSFALVRFETLDENSPRAQTVREVLQAHDARMVTYYGDLHLARLRR